MLNSSWDMLWPLVHIVNPFLLNILYVIKHPAMGTILFHLNSLTITRLSKVPLRIPYSTHSLCWFFVLVVVVFVALSLHDSVSLKSQGLESRPQSRQDQHGPMTRPNSQVSIRTLLETNSLLPLACTWGPTSHLPLSAGANLRLILVTCYFGYLKIPSDKQLTELGFLSFWGI